MSSHHFVKEGQEPALLIIEPISYAVVEPLLEWAPLVVVLDSALAEVLRWGIKIDVVIARLDQVESLTISLNDQAPIKILSYQPGEDPLQTAFYFLMSNKQSGVNIICSSVDGTMATANTFITATDVSILTDQVRWSAIPSGSFRKWVPAGTKFFIKGSDELGNEVLASEDGILSLESKSPFWIGETL